MTLGEGARLRTWGSALRKLSDIVLVTLPLTGVGFAFKVRESMAVNFSDSN